MVGAGPGRLAQPAHLEGGGTGSALSPLACGLVLRQGKTKEVPLNSVAWQGAESFSLQVCFLTDHKNCCSQDRTKRGECMRSSLM